MPNQVQLPVHPNPGFETECYHNFRLSIVLRNDQLLPWYYSHFANLVLIGKEPDDFPMINFAEHLEIYSEVLKEERIPDTPDWTELIRSCLAQGEYVLIYFNWKHIKGSHYYQVRDLFHEALIYGYDDQKQAFQLLAFEVGGKIYGALEVSYEDCQREFVRLRREDMHSQKWFAYFGFPIARIRLKEQLPTSMDMRRLFFSLDRGRVKANPSSYEVYAMGYDLNLYLAHYFGQVITGERRLPTREFTRWNIMIHKMAHHKKLMMRRLEYLDPEGKQQIVSKIKDYYAFSSKALLKSRALSYQYQRTGDGDALKRLSEQFQYIYEQEKRATALLMEFLVLHQLNG
ncbi:hypothetical protein [Brevibacillus fulvus]|uniref:Uncharacterized protein n=1 Tax=Brevibacillus fulvus TaxID=1125967 RepID=A0A939BTN5_9BACL|nr:hypothetical protein [Brevibacillus fulvus]MBM7589654.1 hypothetical protein [Brevibacillus fulvus]